MERMCMGLVILGVRKWAWAHCQVFTWSKSSCSMRSVELILSTTLSDPLYSITAFPTRISLLDIVTTKSPFSKNSPLLLDKAKDEKREFIDLLLFEIILWQAESQSVKNVDFSARHAQAQIRTLPLANYVALGHHFPPLGLDLFIS